MTSRYNLDVMAQSGGSENHGARLKPATCNAVKRCESGKVINQMTAQATKPEDDVKLWASVERLQQE